MDLSVGARVGFIEIIGPPITTNGKHVFSLVRCVCGKEWRARRDSIRQGAIVSCGCKRGGKIKHGMSYAPEYQVWAGMIQRCHNPKGDSYKWYGARGISVCADWRNSFEAFYRDMGPRPANTTLERQNNDLGYGPTNCIWATPLVQAQNTRTTKRVLLDGQSVSVAEAARRLGVDPMVIYHRMSGDKRRGKAKTGAQDAVNAALGGQPAQAPQP